MNETQQISLVSEEEPLNQKNLLTLYKQSISDMSFQKYLNNNFHNRTHTTLTTKKKKIPQKIYQITQNNNYRLPHYINLNNEIFYNSILKIPPEKRIFFTQPNFAENKNNTIFNSFNKNHIKKNLIKDNYLIKIHNQNKTDINLDDKILLVNKNKNLYNLKKTQETFKKFQEKEKKFNLIKNNLIKKKIKNINENNKINNMKKLKIKIKTILETKSINLCSNYENKNFNFNMKLIDFLNSKININNTLNYHKNFHFNKNENGEAHNRLQFLTDIESMKDNENQKKLLEKYLTPNEINLLEEEPNYFLENDELKKFFKPKTLIVRLEKEENLINNNNNNNDNNNEKYYFNKTIEINKNIKEKKKISFNLNKTIEKFKEEMNKKIYNSKLNLKDFKRINKTKKEHEIIFKTMYNDLRENYKKNYLSNKEFDIKKIFLKQNLNNILTNKYDLIDKKVSIQNKKKSNEEILDFKEKEIDLINFYNNKIKDNYHNNYKTKK